MCVIHLHTHSIATVNQEAFRGPQSQQWLIVYIRPLCIAIASRQSDSNRRPVHYKSATLAAELCRRRRSAHYRAPASQTCYRSFFCLAADSSCNIFLSALKSCSHKLGASPQE